MDRETILDLGMQMLAGGASLDDVIAAAANFGVNLYDVYYSDPGTSFSLTEPVDVEPEPVDVPPLTPAEQPPVVTGGLSTISPPTTVKEEPPGALGVLSSAPTAASAQASPNPLTNAQLIAIGEAQKAAETGDYLTPEEGAALQNKIEKIAGRPITTEENINAYFAYQDKVTADAETALKMSAGIDAVDERYDVNNDGQVNSLDSLLIAKGTPVLTDVEVTQQKQVDEAVTTALQNGFSKEEVYDIAKELNIPEDTITKSFNKVVGSKSAADIILGVSALSGKNQTLTYDNIVKYADDNKLPYIDVAEALKDTFQNTSTKQILDSMVYEKDRQQFNNLAKDVTVDGKTVKQVNLGEAIAASIQQSIDPKNLAKFFGKTDEEFKTLVSNNITNVALTMRQAGIDSAQGLSDLLGIDKSTTNQSIRLYDIGQQLNTLATKDSQGNSSIPLDKAIDLAQTNKISDDELSKILNLTTEQIATTRDKLSVQKTLNTLADDGKITINELLGAVNDKNISIDDFVNKYIPENKQATIDALKAESKFTPQERAWRETYSSITTPINIQQAVDFQTANKLSDADMERIFNIPANSLDNYKLQTELPQYAGEDQRLSYNEIIKFANDNNISLSDAVALISTKEEQPDLLSKVESYNKLSATEKLAEQIIEHIDPKSSGGAWTTKSGKSGSAGFGTEGMLQQLAQRIVEKTGIDNLEDLGQRTINVTKDTQVYKVTTDEGDAYRVVTEVTPNGDQISRFVTPEEVQRLTVSKDQEGNDIYSVPITTQVQEAYNKKTGEKIENTDLGGWAEGPEFTRGNLGFDASGKPVVSTYGESSSDAGTIMPIVAFAAAFIAPQLLTQIIGSAGMTASAATQAAISAGATTAAEIATISSALTAGTGLTGSLIASGVSASIAPYAASMIVNGTLQGLITDANDGSFLKGFVAGGVAPVMGQLATNAVNTALSDLKLPTGFDRAVGNAVMQLIATGEIDPKLMLVEGITPAVSNTIQQATGLNAAQTKLLLSTIASEGKNLQGLTDPTKAINFINQNKGVLDNIGLAAASGNPVGIIGQPVDLGAFNESSPGSPRETVNPVLGQTGQDITSFLEANNIYNIGQNKYMGVSPGTIYNLSDLYGYGDGTVADTRSYGDAGVAELMAGFTRPTFGVGDASIAELMASVKKPDAYQMDIVGAEYGTPTSVEWKNVSVPKIKDETGKTHDIPAGAVLNITAEGELIGYRKDNIDFRLDKPGGSFKPTSSTGNATSFNPNNKTDAELWADFQKVVPNATKQQYQGWLMAAIAGEKTGMYVPMSAFIPTEEQRTTLLQDVANLAKGAGTGIALGGSDLALSAIGWAQAAAREAGYNVQFKSLDDVVKFQKEMEAIGNKDFQNIFRSTIMSLPSTAATAGVVMTGGGALGAATVAGASAGLITAGREYADAYSKLISKGYPPDQAHNQALFRSWAIGGAEGLGESIFPGADVKLIRSILNLSPSDIVKQYGTTLAKELPPEIATAALQTYIDTLPGIGLQPNRTYTVDEMLQILRDTTVTTAGQVAVTGAGAKLVQQLTSTPVVNQSGQQVLNRAGAPVLMLTNEQKTTGFHLSYAPPTGGTTMELSAYAQSTPAESIFDAVLENEGKYNYTLQSVNLDNNVFTIKTNDGQTVVFSADQVLNNALNLRTQENPTLAKDVNNSIDIADVLSVDLAKNMQSLPSENISGTIVSASAKGAIMETADGRYIFVPNYGVTSVADGVSAAPIQLGDRVIASNSVLSPVTQIVQPDGAKTLTIDATRVDPLAGLGTVIGLNDSQALVVMPNQQIATVDRANLSTAQNSTLSQGSKIPVNQQVLSGINIPITTIQEDFGLTQTDLLKSVLQPTLTSSNLPYIVPIISPSGTQTLLNTQKPNVGVGTVISTNDLEGTALISTATGNPQVVNMQGSKLTKGSDIFFDPSTGMLLGTPIAPNLVTQTQPKVDVGQSIYTPIGTPTTPGGIDSKTPLLTTPLVTTDVSKIVTPPVTTIDTTPGGIGVDTITGTGATDTTNVNIGADTIPMGADTIPAGTDTVPGGGGSTTTPKVTTPKLTGPSLFFPVTQTETKQMEFGYPTVLPPELSGTYEMPYPNYLRPLDPYLGYGIGSLMGDIYDEKQGDGSNKPLQNAQTQLTIPT